MSNYVCYHLHDWNSMLDSVTNFNDYVDRAVELGQTAIGMSNHGSVQNWIQKKMYCDKKGIKFLFGCEVYLTEQYEPKVRDNYHTILIAKNEDGFKELNLLIDKSTEPEHFYYKNRISFEDFLNISDNVIKISACLANPLNKAKDSVYYDRLCEAYDYYEVQPHNSEDQREYNQYLVELSKRFNKPLIAGTDTHSLNDYKAECRSILQKAKKIEYADEDAFDLTYKSYDELVQMFKEQGVLNDKDILDAIDNTNKMADSCFDIHLDTSFKYPSVSNNENEEFRKLIQEKYADKCRRGVIKPSKRYKEQIHEELMVFEKINMIGFMLFMSKLITWCRDNDIPVGFGRGSCAGSLVAYITDITDVNPVVWDTMFSRFANENRRELGDIDVDFAPDDREKVYNHIIEEFGINYTAYIQTTGTLKDKSVIDEVGRALNIPLDDVSRIKKEYEEEPEVTKEKYPEVFKYYDGLIDCVVSQGFHPAGIVVSPLTLPDNYGTFWYEGKRVLSINMEEVHEVSLVKYDILGLKNVGIIKDCCEFAGLRYPLSHEINWDDEEVWADMITSPVGIFQFESSSAYDLLKRFEPHKINDMSIVNAALRPSGESYREDLINHIPHKNPSEQIDELLAPNNGYLIFQEDTIKFLQNICGLTGSEADNVRRAIGRKQEDRLQAALPQILEGYCSKSDKPREIAEREAKEFLQIIEDSSNYQFGYNHSTAYSLLGYTCAYYRYYYPLEFIAAYLNNASNEDDIINGTALARQKGIKIVAPKFRYSRAKYTIDKESNCIYKGVSSIKFLNEQCVEELYSLRDNQYESFMDLLININNLSINSRQMQILITLNFFSEFGRNDKLLKVYDAFSNYYGKKQIKKSSLSEIPFNVDIIAANSKETEKMFKIDDMLPVLKDYEQSLPDKNISAKEQILAEIEYLGYPVSRYKCDKDTAICIDVNEKYSPKLTLYYLRTGDTETVKCYKKNLYDYYGNKYIDIGTVIKTQEIEMKPKKNKIGDTWVDLEELEPILKRYTVI